MTRECAYIGTIVVRDRIIISHGIIKNVWSTNIIIRNLALAIGWLFLSPCCAIPPNIGLSILWRKFCYFCTCGRWWKKKFSCLFYFWNLQIILDCAMNSCGTEWKLIFFQSVFSFKSFGFYVGENVKGKYWLS